MRGAIVGLVQLVVACTPTSRPKSEAAVSAPAPVAASVPVAEPAADEPITATLLRYRMGKPPLRFYTVRLILDNRREHAVWLLFPDSADDALPDSPVFVASGSLRQAFSSRRHDGVGGEVVEVIMYSDPGFRAFLLPPGGRVVFDDYAFDAWKSVEGVEAWEVAALKVGDDVPLERWLPYPALSARDVRVTQDSEWTPLDSERSRSREDDRDEPVSFVTASVLRRLNVPFRDADP